MRQSLESPPQRPCPIVTVCLLCGGDSSIPAKGAGRKTVVVFSVSVIVGDTCLKLAGIHLYILLFVVVVCI